MEGGFVPEPLEQAAAGLGGGDEDAIEDAISCLGDQGRQTVPGLLVGLLPCRGDETLQARDPWPDNLLTAELVTRELQEQRGLIMF